VERVKGLLSMEKKKNEDVKKYKNKKKNYRRKNVIDLKKSGR
jgi:wobble nucleotide-excising tRNase